MKKLKGLKREEITYLGLCKKKNKSTYNWSENEINYWWSNE